MVYNLCNEGVLYTNNDIGNIYLSFSELLDLTYNNISISLSEGDIICIDCDLGNRISISSINYVFTSMIDSTIVASGISFYYKDYYSDSYTQLLTDYTNNTFYATISGSLYPQFIRIQQSLLAVSGTLSQIEILNDSSQVNFGIDGTLTTGQLSSGLRGIDKIQEIPIHNNSSSINSAYIMLSSTNSPIDNYLSLSTDMINWRGILDHPLIGPNDNWGSGLLSNTMVYNNDLYVNGDFTTGKYATPYNNGSFTSFIFEMIDDFCNISIEGNKIKGTNVSISGTGPGNSIEIRVSDIKPLNCFYYRTCIYSSSGFVDYWCIDNSIKDIITTTSNLIPLYSKICVDQITMNTFVLYTYHNTYDYSNNYPIILRLVTPLLIEKTITLGIQTAQITNFIFMLPESSGGIWLYFYSGSSSGTYTINSTGFYLIHLNNSMVVTFSLFNSTNFIKDMMNEYDSPNLWYLDSLSLQVLKINDYGVLLSNSYDNVDSFISIIDVVDGGCTYLNGTDLITLRYDSLNIATTSNFCSSLNLSSIKQDLLYGFWGISNATINRITSDGRIEFYISITNPVEIKVFLDGIWVKCLDNTYKFIDRAGNILYSFNYISTVSSITYTCIPGFVEFSHHLPQQYEYFPTVKDTLWNNLLWTPISLQYFDFIKNYYYQFRLTLNCDNPSDNYNVVNTTAWVAESGLSGTELPPHLFTTNLTNRVIVSDACRIMPDLNISAVDAIVTSKNRFYLNGNNSNSDFQIDYDLPYGVTNNTLIYLTLRSYTNLTNYYQVYISRILNSTTMSIGLNINGYTQYDTNVVINKTSTVTNYSHYTGTLRFVINDSVLYVYTYNIDTSSWINCSNILVQDYGSLGPRPIYLGNNTFIEFGCSTTGSVVDFSNFIVNSSSNLPYFYKNCPIVSGLYKQSPLLLPNIYPNSSKSAYVKLSNIPDDHTLVGNYESNLKAWWQLEDF